MRYFFFSLLLLSFFAALIACEEDDICVEETTPRMKVKFYSFDNNTPMQLDSLFVFRVEKDGSSQPIIQGQTKVDSIFLPLRLDDVNQTTFYLTKKKLAIPDTLRVNYTKKAFFVSKACGFKFNFFNLEAALTKRQAKGIQLNEKQITNEQTTALRIAY